MANYNDLALTEGTLFELYNSKGYNDTRIALQIALDEITTKILNTKDKFTKKTLEALKQAISEKIQSAYGTIYPAMQEEGVAVANIIADAYLVDISTKTLPTAVIDDLLNSNRQILGYGFKELFQITADNHERAMRVTLASGVAQGMTAAQIVADMQTKNESQLGNLEKAVYTTIKDARSQAQYSSFKQLEKAGVVTGYQSIGVLDSRTSEICRDLDRKIYKVKSIDEVPNKPPRHFRCRSSLSPLTTNQFNTGKRASIDGEIPDMSYGEWFKLKDPAFQKLVLGKSKFEAYKNGNYKVGGVADLGNVKLGLKDIEKALQNNVL